MNKLGILIKPKDTLFFRDARPFRRGVETEGYSIFPPNPSTVYGALRTLFISENGGLDEFLAGKLKNEIGMPPEDKNNRPMDPGDFRIKGVFLADDENIYFPTPMDLISIEGKIESLKLKENNEFKSNIPCKEVLWNEPAGKVKSIQDSFLVAENAASYLRNESKNLHVIEFEDYAVIEPKVGIKRDNETRASSYAMLYRINTIRLKDRYSIYVEYEGVDFPQEGLLKLGGEGKSCYFECIKLSLGDFCKRYLDDIKKGIEKTRRFKLYFATPAIFTDGWKPCWLRKEMNELGTINPEIFKQKYGIALNCKLLTAAISRPKHIGGWDIVNNRSKAMYKVLPAGTVFYFQLSENDTADDVIEAFWYKNISDYYPQEGYGLTWVGV